MATYQLVGTQDPAGRIDRVQVESPTEANPDGKVLELNGAPKELSDEQYGKLAPFVKLELVPDEEGEVVQFVDQPDVNQPSRSTDVVPDPGTTPDVKPMDRNALVAELARVQAAEPGALPELNDKSNKADLAAGLASFYGQEV
jgi:hypothetical protein